METKRAPRAVATKARAFHGPKASPKRTAPATAEAKTLPLAMAKASPAGQPKKVASTVPPVAKTEKKPRRKRRAKKEEEEEVNVVSVEEEEEDVVSVASVEEEEVREELSGSVEAWRLMRMSSREVKSMEPKPNMPRAGQSWCSNQSLKSTKAAKLTEDAAVANNPSASWPI